MISLFDKLENTVFSKAFFLRVVKSRDFVVKSEEDNAVYRHFHLFQQSFLYREICLTPYNQVC